MNIYTKHNEANELAKYKFLDELGVEKDPKTVLHYINAIHEFEVATNFRDFREYNSEWAKEFKHYLNNKKNKRTGQNISQSLYVSYIAHVRNFFEWLAKNEKEYSKLKARDIAFLKVTQNVANQAKATGYQESHDVNDLLSTIRNMPETTNIEKRNKAMFSLCLLTSPRISSLQTARIKSIKFMREYNSWAFLQNPKTQKTKFSKNITSFFVGQSQDIVNNLLNWQQYLQSQGFENNDYLFPRTEMSFSKEGKPTILLAKGMIKSQTIIREALHEAFQNNSLAYRSPHKFRHSITRRARQDGASTDTLLAIAENFGQKTGLATLVASYGDNYLHKQAELMKGINLQ